MEKPKSREEAFNRLKQLSGNKHEFYTGIHMINLNNGKTLTNIVKTTVHLRGLSDDEINKYLDQDDRYTTFALGYDPMKKYSASFIEKLEGSPHNLLCGLPVEKIVKMLNEIK